MSSSSPASSGIIAEQLPTVLGRVDGQRRVVEGDDPPSVALGEPPHDVVGRSPNPV